jgi:hypothetical protein
VVSWPRVRGTITEAAFGWLYTRKGLLDLYVSRTDRLVLVRLRAGRPLLLTPERDEGFVDALRVLSRG